MKISIHTFFFLLTVSFFLISCSEEDKINGTPPTVADIRFNVDQKFIYQKDDGQKDTIILNPAKYKNANFLDTLIFNNPVTLNGKLTSENGLTNMKVEIYGKTLNSGDTTLTSVDVSEVPLTYFFDEKDNVQLENLSVTKSLVFTTPKVTESTGSIATGNEYKYNIYVIDKEGKIDSMSYYQKPIIILTVDEVKLLYSK